MDALERTMGATAWLGSIGALGGVALLVISASLFSRLRRLLEPDRPSSRAPDDRRTAALEMIASLAAAVGLLGTFLALKADGGRLVPIFGPALAGLVVFVFCQGALGLLRSWSEPVPPTPLPAPAPPERTGPLPPPFSQAIGGDPWPTEATRPPDGLPGASSPRRPRRPAAPPIPLSRMDTVARALVMIGCMIGSVLVHAAVFFIALRAHAGSGPAKEPERAGVFAASIVPSPRIPAPPPEEIKKEEPPPEPPKREPEPPKPEPPKTEASETVAAAEPPKSEATPEKPKADAPPAAPPPPPPAETSEPLAKKAEAESPKPAAPPPPPAPRVSETSPPPAAPPAAEPAAAPPPKAGAELPVLGFGEPPKTREKTEPTAGSDPRGTPTGISTLKDYRKFLAREMKPGPAEGQYVPHLRFSDNSTQENKEITRYFGMELIAYPKNQKFYVYISPDQDVFSRSNDFSYIHNFSSRTIFRSSPYFDALRAEAAKRVGVPAESLVVAQLLKPASAAYIGWKESECARRAGVTLDTVEACDATFAKTPFGVWIVRIDRLVLKDGRTLSVEDFEWGRVAPAAGGDK